MTPEEVRALSDDRCYACNLSWYEHRDHAHAELTKQHGRCPFGDCGEYRAARAAQHQEEER